MTFQPLEIITLPPPLNECIHIVSIPFPARKTHDFFTFFVSRKMLILLIRFV